ncbi:subtype I-C CRISPR-associated endonuclease Cas1 [bacterium CG2_30_54_10]|nr:MAG: subtype I-C CRISPR-associated endonuclease Cas1 [bacterium CG2_30_54_10]
MKKLLNTLFVTTQKAYLNHEGEVVVVRVAKEVKLKIPIHTLQSIICFDQVSCSPPLLGLCGRRGVHVAFFDRHGRFLARVQGPVSGNVLLRREQYRRADDPVASSGLARAMVSAKIANCRSVLLRSARERSDQAPERLGQAARELDSALQRLRDPTIALDSVRGVEGDAARVYFEVFDDLVLVEKEAFAFRDRNRRPPLDNMNALLSFIYTLLTHDVASALEGVGLDPAVGFLHRDRPGRPSLALDLMEEFRPFLGDRLALSLVNLQQIRPKGFKKTETGAVRMDDETRRALLVAYQKRKQEIIQHPFLDEKVAIGLLPHVQALLLARHLRGDLDGYPPFIWK